MHFAEVFFCFDVVLLFIAWRWFAWNERYANRVDLLATTANKYSDQLQSCHETMSRRDAIILTYSDSLDRYHAALEEYARKFDRESPPLPPDMPEIINEPIPRLRLVKGSQCSTNTSVTPPEPPLLPVS